MDKMVERARAKHELARPVMHCSSSMVCAAILLQVVLLTKSLDY